MVSDSFAMQKEKVVEMKICVVTPLYAVAGVPLAQLRLARVLASKGNPSDCEDRRNNAYFHINRSLPTTASYSWLMIQSR